MGDAGGDLSETTSSSWRHGNSLFAFDDGDVAIDGQRGETLNQAAGLGPVDFDPVKLGSRANTQDQARIVRGKIAAAADFQAAASEIARLIGNARANGINVGFLADE